MRGYFGIGIENGKTKINLGTLWRSAHIFGASFIFTVGKRYKAQSSDVKKTWKHVPLFEFSTMIDLKGHLPHDCQLVGIEMRREATDVDDFYHPERAAYILGSEDAGLSPEAIAACQCAIIRIFGNDCLNVAVAGSIVLYDRLRQWKQNGKKIDLPTWETASNTRSRRGEMGA